MEAYRKGMLEYYERSSDNTTLECVEYPMNWKGIRLGTENNLLLSKKKKKKRKNKKPEGISLIM